MIESEAQDSRVDVWPPAILPPNPVQRRVVSAKVVRFGRASLTAAGVGGGIWIYTIAHFVLLSASHKEPGSVNTLVHSAYFSGLICEVLGLTFGWIGRRAKVGRVGLMLSAGLLIVMTALTLYDYHTNGTGQWIWNDLDAGDCGCDDTI